MNNKITSFQKRILRWICRRLIIQGPHHKKNITEYYKIIVQEARECFREDNEATIRDFLQECHSDALDDSQPHYCKECHQQINTCASSSVG